MYILFALTSLLTFVFYATAGSVHHRHSHLHEKRYDLDHNGVPDLCEVKSGTAHCLLKNGHWTSFATATYGKAAVATSKAATTVKAVTTKTTTVKTTTSKATTSRTTTSTATTSKTTTSKTTTSKSTASKSSTTRPATSQSGSTNAAPTSQISISQAPSQIISTSYPVSLSFDSIISSLSSAQSTSTTLSSLSPAQSTSTALSSLSSAQSASTVLSGSSTTVSPSISHVSNGSCVMISSATPTSTVTLPAPSTFRSQNGTKWTLEYVGNLNYTDTMQSKNLQGDKCRTGMVGGKVIWNCGDMECEAGWQTCGFSMGPAFYGTDTVGLVNTDNITNIGNSNFAQAWSGDEPPQAPQWAWGMDTSNVVPINDTNGVAFVWEAWRGASDGSTVQRGAGAVAVTLGPTKPIATRVGPLLSGPDAIQLGILAAMRDGCYIYTYSINKLYNIIVGRVPANDDVFDATKYEFLSASDYKTWITPGSIPSASTTAYGMKTSAGGFNCAVYGSVFYSSYLGKYVILCNIWMSVTSMYVSDTPYGPWSDTYEILSGVEGYGSMAHPEYGTNPLYFSLGPNGPFYMYKLTFHY